LLPATERLFDTDDTVQEPLDLRGTERIRVVEDEEALREVIRRIPVRSGYEVQTGASGEAAMAVFQAAPEAFALLVTDVTMPKMVGTELASKLRAIRPDLLVLFISGYAQPVLGSTIGDGTDLLEKPFSEHELLTRVHCVLDDNC
jgi:DNA-binding response OmpR family regulator